MVIADQNFYRYAAWFALTIVLALILYTFLDYGITWDEELQSQYGQAIVDYYASSFQDRRYAEIQNLYLYGGMFDGLAAITDRYMPFRIYDSRHLLNASFGLLGLWGTWRVGRILGGGVVGLLALILCATTPMYYGHMFNNPKDIPFAAGVVWTIYFMVRSYARPEWTVLLRLGIILGLTLGIRVGGVMVLCFWLLPLGVTVWIPWLRHRNINVAHIALSDTIQRAWRVVLPVGALGYAIMLICWPWAQQHPFTNPLGALTEFSNFPHKVDVLLAGTTFLSTQLPWYYVPLYFGIQLPEILLFLLAVFVVVAPKIWRHLKLEQKQGLALILLTTLIPILYAMLRHPPLYDAVRHFLFIVPLMCVLAALAARTGFIWCISKIRQPLARNVAASTMGAVAVLLILVQIITMVRLHPYEYIFANQFTGGVSGAYGRYASDYWGSSFKDAAQKLQEVVAKEGGIPPGKIYRISICGPWDSAMIYLPPDYEFVGADKSAEFFLSTTRWMCQNSRPGKEVIRIERMGVPLSIVKDLRGGFEDYHKN